MPELIVDGSPRLPSGFPKPDFFFVSIHYESPPRDEHGVFQQVYLAQCKPGGNLRPRGGRGRLKLPPGAATISIVPRYSDGSSGGLESQLFTSVVHDSGQGRWQFGTNPAPKERTPQPRPAVVPQVQLLDRKLLKRIVALEQQESPPPYDDRGVWAAIERLENKESPEPYNDASVLRQLEQLEQSLETVSSGITPYNDSAVVQRLSDLETALAESVAQQEALQVALSQLEARQGAALAERDAQVAALTAALEQQAARQAAALEAALAERDVQQEALRASLERLATQQATALAERDAIIAALTAALEQTNARVQTLSEMPPPEPFNAADLWGAIGKLSEYLERLVIPEPYDDAGVQAAITQVQTDVRAIRSALAQRMREAERG